ncbi:hypothetical protein J2Q11_01680 [Tenacibaculum finnmarkense genomovar finnmarkense]|uniref:hypothetical protein n=1 Tax=Tenacibaculum finnmarkense TaxID=2781243 RepID=UPI001E4FA39D|nr:hypothetical protein [Tenacibaculum finnmarkense]MCD8417126.1 hypothetical protein [Tenacibaculum finnmarkense genomovar finnmarkense]MCG8184482.1 hypothetical protein [Tenacibaculum finnmarkense genomovar finnmarkense]MCG8202057.1 hypothetical protein [Tenacibaculum finnmarkense genomovar finnmarkense]MCG8208812.1 hypothetical protein [Tenacibaculum finnmarkense genomovar finnmarkense]MCG8211543.1 hypothetical protein [Tenacibaculum finnmarkense genomovar finnmarkense]
MFNNLDATKFSGSIPLYDINFEDILSKITVCYHKMIVDNSSIKNNENDIIREEIGLIPWLFEREVQEDHSVGRTDIKISSEDTFKITEAYYIIECKRLDSKNTTGKTGLNTEYIHNGIWRFTSKYYSSHYRVNAMIGFITKKLDIDKNIETLNQKLSKYTAINTTKNITKSSFINNFQYHYDSEHLDKDDQKLKIYHLMFDFSANMAC